MLRRNRLDEPFAEAAPVLDELRHLATIELAHTGDCALLGVDHDGRIYVEELYGEDDWLAQHRISLEDGLLESVDERFGAVLAFAPLQMPERIHRPASTKIFAHLNFSGARWRGLADAERIAEIAHHVSIADKIALLDYLGWDNDPHQLLGIVESRILSCCRYNEDAFAVCRRIRVAFRLPDTKKNDDTLDSVYDSIPIHLFHGLCADADELPGLPECLTDFDLCRPIDCMAVDGKLYLADGGSGEIRCALHVFEIK